MKQKGWTWQLGFSGENVNASIHALLNILEGKVVNSQLPISNPAAAKQKKANF